MTGRIYYHDIPGLLERTLFAGASVRELLRTFAYNYQNCQKVTDQDLLAFNAVFGESFEKALPLVQKKRVRYYYIKTDIGVYQVKESAEKIYTIFPYVNYCSCNTYKNKVTNGELIACKHVLASALAEVIHYTHRTEITSEQMTELLLKSVTIKCTMNEREDWNNPSPFMGQFIPPHPQNTHRNAQPISVPSSFGSPSNDWAQVPPQTMPWGTPPETQPTVVRFTAGGFNPHVFPGKRKCDVIMDSPPAKMLVTEEKMAAHLRDLHISDEPTPTMSCKDDSMDADRLPKLVLSDEIKNLKNDPIIPDAILKKLEKPEMALVLWQPPATDLCSKIRELRKLSVFRPKGKGREREKDKKPEVVEMEIATEEMNETETNVFRPIDPVPLPFTQNQFYQPVPQFHGYSPFQQDNFQS